MTQHGDAGTWAERNRSGGVGPGSPTPVVAFPRVAIYLAMLLMALTTPVRAGDTAVAGRPSADATNATVLVLVDIQNFYFADGKLPLVEPNAASRQARLLLEHFRTRSWPVVHVQHLPKEQTTPTPDSGDVQYQIHADVRPIVGEAVIGKHQANAFRDTALLATLRRLGARRLVIAGMQTHMCVEAAARAAADLGFEVVVAHDACATRDLTFESRTIPAAQVHAATLASLQGNYARVVSTGGLLAELR